MGIIDKIRDALPIKLADKGRSSAAVQKPSGEMNDWQRRHLEALVRYEKASAAAPNPGALEQQMRLEQRRLQKLNPGTQVGPRNRGYEQGISAGGKSGSLCRPRKESSPERPGCGKESG